MPQDNFDGMLKMLKKANPEYVFSLQNLRKGYLKASGMYHTDKMPNKGVLPFQILQEHYSALVPFINPENQISQRQYTDIAQKLLASSEATRNTIMNAINDSSATQSVAIQEAMQEIRQKEQERQSTLAAAAKVATERAANPLLWRQDRIASERLALLKEVVQKNIFTKKNVESLKNLCYYKFFTPFSPIKEGMLDSLHEFASDSANLALRLLAVYLIGITGYVSVILILVALMAASRVVNEADLRERAMEAEEYEDENLEVNIGLEFLSYFGLHTIESIIYHALVLALNPFIDLLAFATRSMATLIPSTAYDRYQEATTSNMQLVPVL